MHIRADTQIACDVLCCFKGWVQRAFLSLLVISTSANTRKRDRHTRTHTQHRWMEGHPALTGVEIQDKDTQDTKTQTPLKVHTRTSWLSHAVLLYARGSLGAPEQWRDVSRQHYEEEETRLVARWAPFKYPYCTNFQCPLGSPLLDNFQWIWNLVQWGLRNF